MRVKEDADLKEIKWKTTFKSLEDEKRDLKFILKQKGKENRPALGESNALENPLTQHDRDWAEQLRKADQRYPPFFNHPHPSHPISIDLEPSSTAMRQPKPNASEISQ